MKWTLAGKEAVSEDEVEAIVQGRREQNDGDLSSISGSDAESSADEATDDHSGPKRHPLQQRDMGYNIVQKIEFESGHCMYVVRAKARGRQATHDATD
ncbi:unnamed protein product [Sphagnum balticum]